MSVGELEMTRRISAVAVCWSNASASWRSRAGTAQPPPPAASRDRGPWTPHSSATCAKQRAWLYPLRVLDPDPSASPCLGHRIGRAQARRRSSYGQGRGYGGADGSSQSMPVSACSNQYAIPISRYIVVAVVRCSRACSRLPVRRYSLPRPRWQWAMTIESLSFYAALARPRTEKDHLVNVGRSGLGPPQKNSGTSVVSTAVARRLRKARKRPQKLGNARR